MEDYYVEYDGTTYYHDGQVFHRENGPAIICLSGTKLWFKHGRAHRCDGPAEEWCNGTKKYFYEGVEIKCNSTEEFLRIISLKGFW